MNAVIECSLPNNELLSRFKIFVSPSELKKGIWEWDVKSYSCGISF